jgi:phage terminase small subunit
MTPRQAIFYGEYIKDGNGTRATIAAGFPEKSAHVAAARMLKNAKVKAAIDGWSARTLQKLEMSAEEVLRELSKVGKFDARRLYDKDGNRLPVHLLDDVTAAAIVGVEDETTEGPCFVTTRKQRVRAADKLRALELLGKRHRLFGEGDAFSATVQPASEDAPRLTVTFVKAG